ncbi:MAG: hypothetical protein JWP63_5491 [Candidatus Solibacter sp.]|nr:hypothetical protein [Candidatus Solibacter sp.]
MVQLAFQIGAYLVGLSLELAIMVVLLRGQWRRYPFAFLYLIGEFLVTVLEIEPSLGRGTATDAEKHSFAILYWINERILHVLLFLLVISLVYRATAHLRPRRTLLLLVIAGTLVFAGVTLLIHFDGGVRLGKWMTPWTRDLNFFAAVLDVGLWAMLIGARNKDYKLLLISGALGIQVTGEAIGQALRDMSNSPLVATLTGDFITVANIACLYIWWQAFRLPAAASDGARRRAVSPTPQS